jgi:hypothetical protein
VEAVAQGYSDCQQRVLLTSKVVADEQMPRIVSWKAVEAVDEISGSVPESSGHFSCALHGLWQTGNLPLPLSAAVPP